MAKQDKTTDKTIKVEFLKSPTGHFGLAYNVGETATLEAKIAEDLIELEFAKKA